MVKVVEQWARQHFHSSPSNAGILQDNRTSALAPQTFPGSPEQEVISLFLYFYPGAVGHAFLFLSALVPGLSQELSLSYLPEIINPHNSPMKLRWLSTFWEINKLKLIELKKLAQNHTLDKCQSVFQTQDSNQDSFSFWVFTVTTSVGVNILMQPSWLPRTEPRHKKKSTYPGLIKALWWLRLEKSLNPSLMLLRVMWSSQQCLFC